MTESNATLASEKEKRTKQLKRRMECWREVLLPLNSILLWEKSWYPGIIVGITTSVCSLIWILEPTFLTVVSICLLTLALLDYLAPVIASSFFSSGAWNGQKERKLDEICQRLSESIFQIQNACKFLLNARNDSPKIYYGSIIPCLMFLAWFGNTVNNLFLAYVAVNVLLLAPGLRHKGRAQAALKHAFNSLLHRKLS